MKEHYDEGRVKMRVDEAITKAVALELPLKSIELNSDEWEMFYETMRLVPGFVMPLSTILSMQYRDIKIYKARKL